MQPTGWAPAFSQSERAASESELARHMPTAHQRSLRPQPANVDTGKMPLDVPHDMDPFHDITFGKVQLSMPYRAKPDD